MFLNSDCDSKGKVCSDVLSRNFDEREQTLLR